MLQPVHFCSSDHPMSHNPFCTNPPSTTTWLATWCLSVCASWVFLRRLNWLLPHSFLQLFTLVFGCPFLPTDHLHTLPASNINRHLFLKHRGVPLWPLDAKNESLAPVSIPSSLAPVSIPASLHGGLVPLNLKTDHLHEKKSQTDPLPAAAAMCLPQLQSFCCCDVNGMTSSALSLGPNQVSTNASHQCSCSPSERRDSSWHTRTSRRTSSFSPSLLSPSSKYTPNVSTLVARPTSSLLPHS